MSEQALGTWAQVQVFFHDVRDAVLLTGVDSPARPPRNHAGAEQRLNPSFPSSSVHASQLGRLWSSRPGPQESAFLQLPGDTDAADPRAQVKPGGTLV